MDLLAICLILLSICLFCISPFLFATNRIYGFPFSGLSFLFIGFILFCFGIFLLWFTYRFYLRLLSKKHYQLSKHISLNQKRIEEIIFVNNKGIWSYENAGTHVGFRLRGCFFKKSFLISFVIRSIRYPLVSDKLPIKLLGKRYLDGFNKTIIVYAIFQKKQSRKRVTLVENGKSFCGLIPRLIIKTKLPTAHERFKPSNRTFGNKVIHVNEEIFAEF